MVAWLVTGLPRSDSLPARRRHGTTHWRRCHDDNGCRVLPVRCRCGYSRSGSFDLYRRYQLWRGARFREVPGDPSRERPLSGASRAPRWQTRWRARLDGGHRFVRRPAQPSPHVKDALQDLARIQRAPLARAGVTVTKTSSPTEQQQRLLAAIGAPLPKRHTAV